MPTLKADLLAKYTLWKDRPVRRHDSAAVVDFPLDGAAEQVTDRCTIENDGGALPSKQDVDDETNENEDYIAAMLMLIQDVREVEE